MKKKLACACAVLAVTWIACLAAQCETAESPTAYRASVTVGSTAINTVRPLLFGDNIEWANEGMGIWRPDLHGFDPTILAMLKESGVRNLRYPGGALSDYFHRQQAIGGVRTPQVNPFQGGATQMPDFSPDEFIALCRALDIKGSITVNAGTGSPDSVSNLDDLGVAFTFVPINSGAMLLAAQRWAQTRSSGRPTGDPKSLDVDVILAAQALSRDVSGGEPPVATSNVGHLTRFCTAKDGRDITP